MGKDNELLHAVKNGDVSSIRKLLQKFKSGQKGKKSVIKKVHINAPDEDGFTALHHAALVNNVEVVLALIDMDADPNSRDKKGMCPLHMASWAGKDQVVKALLDNRALVNLPSFGGETPLLLASQHGYANVVEVLLKYNADPTIRNNDLESPLDLACQFGHAAAVRLLLMRGEVVHMLRDRHLDVRYKKPLHLASKGGHNDVIRLLIESGADVNEESSHGTSLHLAALYGKVDVIKILLEAGADVYAKNKKNMTPLDMVNQFTTSRAGIEIKQLLREAAGERILYARAVTDNVNVYDPTCLQFKSGDTVTVLEQNEDGRWKGSVVNGQEERVGFFPAKAVKLISKRRDTQSLGSMSSSSDSSISSASSKDIHQVPTSPSRRMTDSRQPVGVVPIGSFEVLTLATGQTQEKKKPANIPRLNSFKKGLAPARARKAISYEETQEEPSNSIDTSMDSGVDSHAGGEPFASTSYDRLPHPIKAVEPSFYDSVPPQSVSGSRNVAMDGQQAQNGGESRHVAMDGQQAQQASQENFPQRQSVSSGVNYADILVKPNGEKPSLSPSPHAMPSGYSQVYVSERPVWHEQDHGIASNVVAIPEKIHHQQLGFKESYEKMDFTEDSLARHSRSPEERSSLKSQLRTRGYEEMRTNSPIDEPFPSPPLLPVKGQSFIYDEDEVPLPPKKIESRAIKGRQDSYENVKPRQIVPVHAQNPFDKHPRAGKELLTSPHQPPQPPSQDQTAAYADYQNYKAPGLPMQRSNTSSYENYRPPEVDDRIIRAATVSEKPYRVPISRPVPLPPKMNRRSSQEAATLQPFSPSDASSNSPFFCQMNLDDLQEDERELLSWLIDLKLPQYFHNFQIEGYDMISVRGISPEDLTAVDITKAGHKKKLLSEIAKLGQSNKLPSYKPDDVGVWLGLLCLKDYEENFIEGGFDDMDFIKDLDLADLEMIEIRKKGHQKKLLLAVQKLSDIDLTADLDKVVQVSSNNQPMIEPQQQQQESSRLYDIRENENSLSTPQRSYQEIPKAPPPPPLDSFDKSFLSNRDNLPPPSGTESISSSHDPLQPVPPRAPIHFTQTAAKPSVAPEPLQPIPRDRSATSPNAPRPKPKPKPDQNRGQVRTATEYHATESPGKSVILPSPVVSPKPASQFSAEEPDDVTATRSRDFGQQQQQQPATTTTTTTTMNTPTRQKSLSTGVKPLTSPRPLPKPKPKPSIKAKAVIEPPRDSPSTNGVTTPRSSVKKVPPPAPPRRDSMKKKEKMVEPEAENDAEVAAVDGPRTMSGPLDEKIRGVFRGNKHGAHRPVQAAVLEMKQEEEKEIETESNIVEELEATDSIMADIDNMIADFNNQLDSMF